jgi:hypothetical protein
MLRTRSDDVIFLRLDDEDIAGVTDGDGYIDLRRCSAVNAAEQIIDKWFERQIAPSPLTRIPPQTSATRSGRAPSRKCKEFGGA